MTEKQVIQIIKAWNRRIDRFITEELPDLLGYPEGTTEIRMTEWFDAQRIIREQNFYETGREIQMGLRNAGFDVKMDMQSDKLVYGNIR